MLHGRARHVLARRLSLRLGLVTRRRPLLCARLLLGLDPLLRVRRLGLLGLLALRALPPVVPAIGADHAIVMLGMLKEVLGADPVSGRERVLRQGLVFLDDLKGSSPDSSLGPLLSKVEPRP